jgi:tetratricopeptide (TPR) repeat protein
MKRIFKIFKIVLGVILTAYSVVIISFLLFSPFEDRYYLASHMQGVIFSQSMFEILKFQEPENDKIYFEQSVPFNKRGYYAKGFSLLDKAVALNPKVHLGYRGYMKLRFLRNYTAALEDFDRLDALTPNFVDAPWGEDIDFLRGEANFGLENYEKAIIHFKKSIENQGEDWVDNQTYVLLGICEYRLGNLEEAITYHQKALSESEYTVEAYIELAKIYLEQNKTEAAKTHLEQANKYFNYKRDDPYNEYLNEVYKSDLVLLENSGA